MDAGLLAQYVIVALAVLASAWVVLKKQFPGTVRRARSALALRLLRPGSTGWRRTLGERIAPTTGTGGGACGGCDGCGPPPPKTR